jgi:hypothetical protein
MIEPIPTWTMVWLALALAIGLVVGIGLLALAARTREWPEFALGAFGVTASLGNLGTVASLRLEMMAGADFAGPLAAASQLLAISGNASLGLATWFVYRRGERWASLFLAAGVAALLAGWAGNALRGTAAQLGEHTPANLTLQAARFAMFAWWGVESFLHAARLKRRAALGLADPWLVHRVTLWGMTGLAGSVAIVGVFSAGLVPPGPQPVRTLLYATIAGASLAVTLCALVAFFPPEFYRRRFGAPAPQGMVVE